jgi:hypothetical protein
MTILQTSARRPARLRRAAAVGLAAAAVLSFAAPAHAATTPISGATSWGPCTWYTSNNVRYTTVANKTVRVRLSDTGKLGVKMRTLNVNSGVTSAIRYYPPLDTWQNLGTFSAKNSPFRLQFTCVTPRKSGESPETDFAGSLDH